LSLFDPSLNLVFLHLLTVYMIGCNVNAQFYIGA